MYRLDDKGSYALLVAYVDDILYVSSSTSLGDRIETELKKSLDLTISTKAAVAINIPKTLPKAATLGIFSFVKALLAARKTGAATLFVPLNAVYLTKDLLQYGADKFDRIMKYHLIENNKYRIEDLKAMTEDTRLPTMEGSSVKIFSKKNATVVMLQGRVFLPSVVVVPNVYIGSKMAVHLISHHLLPMSFTP
ncbi:unnamed protein product [Closterium sp. NIES-54]